MDDLNIFEYSVVCPECKTKTVMVIVESDLTLFTCSSCKQHIMLFKNSLYKIRDEFLKEIIAKYSTEECGSVVFTRKSQESEEYITKDKLEDLKKTLDNTFFIDDFLDNL